MPGMKLVYCKEHKDPNSTTNGSPDILAYRDSVRIDEHRTQYDQALLNIELKADNSWNPFVDPPYCQKGDYTAEEIHEFVSPVLTRAETRGQLAFYATEISGRQHRLHLFTLCMGNSWVRLFRWDQSGTIVTRQFSFRQGRLLVTFLWRFARLSSSQIGFDPTVSVVTSESEQAMVKQHLARWAKLRLERPVVRIVVTDQETNVDRVCFAWWAIAERDSIIGRATRGYPVYDPLTDEIIFLKDSWRDLRTTPESDTLRKLNKGKVPHVPTFVAGGDIALHETVNHLYVSQKWRCGPMSLARSAIRGRIHHRFLEKEVGVPLKEFQSSKQLAQAIYHAFQGLLQLYLRTLCADVQNLIGHRGALQLCNILHRDISGGNILLLPNGDGLLNDWDLARDIDEMEMEGQQQHERTVGAVFTFLSTYTHFELREHGISCQPDCLNYRPKFMKLQTT